MKRGRILFNGAVLAVTEKSGQVQLPDGRLVAEDAVTWLPPIAPRTCFALGLNYADHATELAFKAPENPLVFLKGPNAFTAHRCTSRRPADATYMHYECELAVVIGQTAKDVPEAGALAHVAGYTVANDYAIRDYLENYYRPNLRVKNRDGCTPLGPWLVDAADVADPQDLRLRTLVNGTVTQEGTTKDMIFPVATLISYLSGIMTLEPGDVILTGTPKGLADVTHGDEVVCEIEGICALTNTIIDDETAFSLTK